MPNRSPFRRGRRALVAAVAAALAVPLAVGTAPAATAASPAPATAARPGVPHRPRPARRPRRDRRGRRQRLSRCGWTTDAARSASPPAPRASTRASRCGRRPAAGRQHHEVLRVHDRPAARRRAPLSLDDSVEHWLPGLVPDGDGITLRQLLNHTSGISDYTEDEAFLTALLSDPLREYTPRQLVGIATAYPPNFPPGTSWSYSNTGYVILGLVVERVTHRPVADRVRQRIIRPLHLRDTLLPTGSRTSPATTRTATSRRRSATRCRRRAAARTSTSTSPSSAPRWPVPRAR
jgi:D-alanyl-D-alanine carboxypeptidase